MGDELKKIENMTEPELAALLSAIGQTVERVASMMNVEKPLFALLLFNDPAVAQYIGNCDREDMIKAFREAADRLEKKEDIPRSVSSDNDDECGICGGLAPARGSPCPKCGAVGR